MKTVTPPYTYALNANKPLRANAFTEVMKVETASLLQGDHTGGVLKQIREQSGKKTSSTGVVDSGIYQLKQ